MNIFKKIYNFIKYNWREYCVLKYYKNIPPLKTTKDEYRTDYIFSPTYPVIFSKNSKNELLIDDTEHLEITHTEKIMENEAIELKINKEDNKIFLKYKEN